MTLLDHKVHLLVDPDHWQPADLRVAVLDLPPIIGSIIVGGTYIHGPGFNEAVEICRQTGRKVGTYLTAGPPDCILHPQADFVIVPILLTASTTTFVTQHLLSAVAAIQRYRTDVHCVAYVMLDGAAPTAAHFFTNVAPAPRNKPELISLLSHAALYLGLQGIYLDAGSGSRVPPTQEEIQAARVSSNLPVIVGGGVTDRTAIDALFSWGADAVVIGSEVEKRKDLKWLRP